MLAALLLMAMAVGCSAAPAANSPRKDVLLRDGWAFIRQDVPAAQSPQFDDSRWQRIALPHTWNAHDGQDGGNDYYRGRGWYRLHLNVDAADLRKQLFLRFEAASLVAQVYLNGQFAGTHRGGFAAFCFNVTPLLHAGDNVVAVCVDNSHFDDIPPHSGDFTICGGLYRNVHLLALNAVNITPTDDGSPGVYLRTLDLAETSANVQATVKLHNDGDGTQSIVAACAIKDASGATVATAQAQQTIAARSAADAMLSLVIPHPHLWNGRADPYLYQAVVELKRGSEVLDRVVQPLGLRQYRIDPQAGFFLNGRSYPLRGVCVHQDYLNKGWAIAPADIDTNYRLINELGASAVRLAHYQHPDYEYAVCDRSGVVVWAELPMVNRIGDTAAFSENAKQQLRELIKQNYNHPSICFWSLFNELGPRTRTDWQLVSQVNELAHDLDADRPTVAASHLPVGIPVNWIPDLIAFNRYFGWYSGTIADWPRELDALHAARPDRAIGISEYGAGASVNQHQDRMTTRPSTKGPWHPEEWQALVHEAAYRAIQQRPWLWGTFVWVMFDFAS
ncbi:MAG TPA: glycoside hydrolase family 2 TIM barrel-domain containing protein, partial [Tepidisphaeraceae bacterium]|nr:glycoside hydrolase family 2 TIM barrel-domain containing protein [Tepidisphaeraceae bacterium]